MIGNEMRPGRRLFALTYLYSEPAAIAGDCLSHSGLSMETLDR